MSITPDSREYRSFELRSKKTENEESDGMVLVGRAVVFDSPEVMYEDGDTKFYEQVSRDAFKDAKIDDVILNMNHEGQALARTRNNTLQLTVNEHGLDIEADMSKSQASREAYEAVQNGLLDRMSFAFTVAQDSYDKETRTRTIEKIDRLFDVSLVNFPAYEATSVSARSYFEAQAEAERQAAEAAKEAAEAERVRTEQRAMLVEKLNRLEGVE